MQATANTKRFGSGRFGTLAVALGFAAGLALGAAAPVVVDNLPSLPRNATTFERPKAYFSAGQGEGLVAGQLAIAAPKAYYSAGMGEGLVGGNNAITTTQVRAHFSAGMGEGWLALGRPVATLQAFPSIGQGEGWVGFGRPVPVVKAYFSIGQGEGWLANGRPQETTMLRAPGEGFVGGGGR
jgi:hypothetical protein